MEDIRRKLSSNPFAHDFVVDILVSKNHVQFQNFDKKTVNYFEAMGKIRSIVKSLDKKKGLITESITFRYNYQSKNIFEGSDFIAMLRDFAQTYNSKSHIRLNIERAAFYRSF